MFIKIEILGKRRWQYLNSDYKAPGNSLDYD